MLRYDHEAISCEKNDDHILVDVKSKKDGTVYKIKSKLLLLATGATAGPLKKFQIPHRETPSAVAGRAYYVKRDMPKDEPLHVIWDQNLVPGYGWFFPMKDNIYNVGIGVLTEQYKHNKNINRLFEQFIVENPIAKEILKGAKPLSDFKGAPLRCGLIGAKPSVKRILLVGEAIGTTFNLIGEGVGKAMETGYLAATVAIEALKKNDFSESFLEKYDRELEKLFRKRYRQYAYAQQFSEHPWFINFMFNRANQNPKVKRKMLDVLMEKRLPGELFSYLGMLKTYF
jgi:flavin-dependent dehydrogenase